ncbi:MAG: hypothetical protein HGA47_07515 [Zoogloea sp.]|nr:hypothetical protein [Zoogloea sp.]
MSFSDLAALCIHDVKNRLAALAARAEARGDAETLRDALGSAGQLTQLLACYKMDAGLLRPEIDAHCPADLVAELVMENRALTPLEIVADCDAAPELWFYDDALVRMILANALQNAMRFARRRIVLKAQSVGDWLEFKVCDDGDGYPPALLADQTQAAPVSREGVGIGLHLARKVAALHENKGLAGTIALSNEPGAVFSLKLPR